MIMGKSAVPPNGYDLLYQDALSRRVRHKRIQKAFMEKDCTFTPQINNGAHPDLSTSQR